jgi:hypothetical protein
MERLRLAVWRMDEMRISRAQVSCELVQCVTPNENAGRRVEDAIIRVELLNPCATAGSVAFAEKLPGGCVSAAHGSCLTRPTSGGRPRSIPASPAVKQAQSLRTAQGPEPTAAR